jgi:hypothetical protein
MWSGMWDGGFGLRGCAISMRVSEKSIWVVDNVSRRVILYPSRAGLRQQNKRGYYDDNFEFYSGVRHNRPDGAVVFGVAKG